MQIIQPPGEAYVALLFEDHRVSRCIPTDGRPHIGGNIKLVNGDSVGRWEGNSFVIDVTNFNGYTWFDDSGNFHTDAAHVVERLTMIDAALGTTVSVPTPAGDVEVEVRAGTQPGEVRSLVGQGMPSLRGSRRGDLHVRLDVAVPTRLDEEQRRVLEDLGGKLGPEAYDAPAAEEEGFFRRLKSALR